MKKVRRSVYVTQIVIAIIMIILFTMITPKASFDPLYLPFEVYLFIIVVMLLIGNIGGILFKLFGIKWARTDSEKFLLVKGYMKKGIIFAVAAILFMGVINFFTPVIDESVDTNTTLVFENQYNVTFMGQDSFATTGITKITVKSEDDPAILLNVFILRKRDYDKQLYEKRFNIADYESISVSQMSYERDSFLPHDEYVLFIDGANQVVKVTYTIERTVASNFVPYFTILPLIFSVLNAGWVAYLFPIRKRFEKNAIYE
jgi:hypothetical protein